MEPLSDEEIEVFRAILRALESRELGVHPPLARAQRIEMLVQKIVNAVP